VDIIYEAGGTIRDDVGQNVPQAISGLVNFTWKIVGLKQSGF